MEKQEISIARGEWGQTAGEILAGCFTFAGALDEVRSQVESGLASLFFIEHGGEVLGAFVLRVDGREGVIVAASAAPSLMVQLLPEIERLFIGCDSMRVHTARPAVARLVASAGYVGQEIVLRKRIK